MKMTLEKFIKLHKLKTILKILILALDFSFKYKMNFRIKKYYLIVHGKIWCKFILYNCLTG